MTALIWRGLLNTQFGAVNQFLGLDIPRPRASFGHGAALKLADELTLLGSYLAGAAFAVAGSTGEYLQYLLPVVNAAATPGADLLAAWYERNIRIFANLHRMGLAPEDRVFVIYGAGHVPILRQLVADSPYFCVEDPLEYLPAP